MQKGWQSSGTMKPCDEPEGSASICDAYNIELHDDPVCLPGCGAFVIAELTPMLGTSPRKQVVVSTTQSLSIRPDHDTQVVPIPKTAA
jgi:hypothetical protein